MEDNKDTLSVNKKDIAAIKLEAGELIFEQRAEDALLQLIKIKDTVDAALLEAKEKIKEAGLQMSPDFKGIKGNRVQVVYQETGYKYEISGAPDAQFMKKTIYVRPDSVAIDRFKDAFKSVPVGIIEKEREKKIIINVTKDEPKTEIPL